MNNSLRDLHVDVLLHFDNSRNILGTPFMRLHYLFSLGPRGCQLIVSIGHYILVICTLIRIHV